MTTSKLAAAILAAATVYETVLLYLVPARRGSAALILLTCAVSLALAPALWRASTEAAWLALLMLSLRSGTLEPPLAIDDERIRFQYKGEFHMSALDLAAAVLIAIVLVLSYRRRRRLPAPTHS